MEYVFKGKLDRQRTIIMLPVAKGVTAIYAKTFLCLDFSILEKKIENVEKWAEL